jgi:hypothetical protein
MKFSKLARRMATRVALVAVVAGLPVGIIAASATPAAAYQACQTRAGTFSPFSTWADKSQYFTLQGSQFEAAPAALGWMLYGGAGVVTGNEPWKVVSSADTKSVQIPSAGWLTSGMFCVYPNEPSMRFFVKSPGVKGSKLTVTFTGTIMANATQIYAPKPSVNLTYTIDGSVAGWVPTPVLPVPQVAGTYESMVVMKVAASGGGSWLVDDFEVDPWRGN